MTPTVQAQQVLRDFSITTAPAMSIHRIFEHHNIICDEGEYSDPNYMGSLIRAEGKTFILVNTDIKNVGRINFTKAHELGHFSLKHKGQQFECSRNDMKYSTRKPIEIEANQFAREFLLPEFMLKPITISAPFDFDTIKSIGNNFMVSKHTAIYRILDFHLGNYAFVNSMDGIITHSGLSKSLQGKINLKKPGTVIDGRSFACGLVNSSEQMNGYASIDSSVWIAKNLAQSRISLKEYSRVNKSAGTVMSLLKIDFL
jgi:Zn-dependent peptidase ImmA (M78 family)